jgi:uncharacterized membrane protein
MNVVILVLHVIAAATWFGATMLLVLVVAPALRAAGPDAAQVLAPQLFRRVPPIMGVAGATTIISGIWMYALLGGGFARSTGGMLVSAGAACGILAIVTGIITGRMQTRGELFAGLTLLLLFCALTLMIVGSRV